MKLSRWVPYLVYLVTVAVLAAVYLIAAKLGLKLAFVHASATAVWPPTGIALAAFLVFGYRAWPGIFAGAYLANITTAGTVATSLGIAAGNTLEGLTGAYLVNRFAGGIHAFERPQDAFQSSCGRRFDSVHVKRRRPPSCSRGSRSGTPCVGSVPLPGKRRTSPCCCCKRSSASPPCWPWCLRRWWPSAIGLQRNARRSLRSCSTPTSTSRPYEVCCPCAPPARRSAMTRATGTMSRTISTRIRRRRSPTASVRTA